jgi:L,D-transpeptidase YcbB
MDTYDGILRVRIWSRFIAGALLASSALLAFISLSQAIGLDQGATPRDELSLQIASFIDNSGPLIVEGAILDRAALARVYRSRNDEAAWIAHPEAATALMNALAASPKEGIDPAGIGVGLVATALADPTLSPAARDILLTDRFIRYASALAQGQVDPASTEDDWALDRPAFDPAPVLARVAAGDDVNAIFESLAPRRVEYARLRTALARYTQLAAAGGWQSMPGVSTSDPGQAKAILPALRQRLAIEGDLPADQTTGDGMDAALTAALTHFQARHGLEADGRIGPATLATLNVSAIERVGQLRLALERMRAMPHDWPATRLDVNIPSATLVLFRDDKAVLTSRVVVGDPKHPTPVLGSAIQSILFNPPWNVPSSIVRNEIQPRLARDPGYLERNHFLLVGHGDGGSADVDWTQTDILANGWRVQQQPGPWNALGIVMFDFPSPFAVYLHDTPARSFFARASRGLSHGCVRVEAATALAGELLGPSGSPDAIQKIVAGGTSERDALPVPMPVYLTYITAFVDVDGTTQFRDDLYGRDKRLAAALLSIEATEPPRIALSLSHR